MLFQGHPACPGLNHPMQLAFSPLWGRGHLGAGLQKPALQAHAGGQGHGARLTQHGSKLGEWATMVKAKPGLFSSLRASEVFLKQLF